MGSVAVAGLTSVAGVYDTSASAAAAAPTFTAVPLGTPAGAQAGPHRLATLGHA
jgi:hypothetical protein